MPRHSSAVIENPEAYNRAIQARIHANARLTRSRKFREDHPKLDEWYHFNGWDGQREIKHVAGVMPEFLRTSIDQWGGLTDGQARKAYEIYDERTTQNAARADAETARRANAPHWTAGRQKITGTIKSIRSEEIGVGYGRSVTSWKSLIALEDGRLLWTSIPRSLIDGSYDDIRNLRGVAVTMTVTVTPKESDATFAFGKRPSNGERVT